jgi:hypothetical protein
MRAKGVRGGGPGHVAVAATARAWRARAGSASVRERGAGTGGRWGKLTGGLAWEQDPAVERGG